MTRSRHLNKTAPGTSERFTEMLKETSLLHSPRRRRGDRTSLCSVLRCLRKQDENETLGFWGHFLPLLFEEIPLCTPGYLEPA